MDGWQFTRLFHCGAAPTTTLHRTSRYVPPARAYIPHSTAWAVSVRLARMTRRRLHSAHARIAPARPENPCSVAGSAGLVLHRIAMGWRGQGKARTPTNPAAGHLKCHHGRRWHHRRCGRCPSGSVEIPTVAARDVAQCEWRQQQQRLQQRCRYQRRQQRLRRATVYARD